MPKATVTVRELKNKDTGIDLSVTGFQEIPGLMRSTYEFQIVVVTNLSCFKLPSHKETDVVQFTLFKKFSDFEDLRARLNETFSGTAFPMLVKKSIIVNEPVAKERRNSLDAFLRFVSATPRIVTCSHVLSFLGVDEHKAKRFSRGDADTSSPQEREGEDEENEGKKESAPMEKSASSLFTDEDEDDEEGVEFITAGSSAAADDDDFFSAENFSKPSAVSAARLFEKQDLKSGLTEEDEKEFSFVADAIITKKEVVIVSSQDDGDDELLNVEEDIDLNELLALEPSPPKPTEINLTMSPSLSPPKLEPVPPTKSHILHKPTIPKKPTPSAKPVVASKPAPAGDVPGSAKPKPAIATKPKRGAAAPDSDKAPRPPSLQEKPEAAPQHRQPSSPAKGEKDGAGLRAEKKDDLSSDDIMKYIVANNAEEEQDEDDLFS